MQTDRNDKNSRLNCPICSSQEESVVNDITAKLILRKFNRGAEICAQQEPCHGLFLIAKGTVKVFRLSSEGKETVLAMLTDGDTFGEASLHQKQFTESVAALTEVELFFLRAEDLAQVLTQHPTLYPSVLNAMIRWVDRLNQVIDNISTTSAKERVSRYIRTLAEESPRTLKFDSDESTERALNGDRAQGERPLTVELPFKKHEVALMLGLRPETLSRAFSDLESDGIIGLDHRRILVFQSERL